MLVKELMAEKQKLQDRIKNLINNFEKKTDVKVTQLGITRAILAKSISDKTITKPQVCNIETTIIIE